MASTMRELINRTAQRLSMVHGGGVQVYAEDRLQEMVQHKFDVLFDEAYWDQFTEWYEWTLDGTLGVVTTDLTDILKRLEDIQVMYIEDTLSKVTKLPSTVNPYILTGTTPIHYASKSSVTKPFKIYPATATGIIQTRVRTKPNTFELDDEVNFDEQCLVLGAAYDYAEDDGTNPAATAKLQGLFENRVSQIKKNNVKDIPLDPASYRPETFRFTPLP